MDLLNLDVNHGEDVDNSIRSTSSPLYANTETGDCNCPCRVHYNTYKPKKVAKSVAGIHKASTMPRRVVYSEMNSAYQQTLL